jgi:DNA-binding response OmpR family regulator
VLLLTITDTKVEGILLGASDVLAKPFSQQQLHQKITTLVQERDRPLALVAAGDPLARAILCQGVQQVDCRLLEAEKGDTLL